jgi:hypothetical protein
MVCIEEENIKSSDLLLTIKQCKILKKVVAFFFLLKIQIKTNTLSLLCGIVGG